MNLFCVAAAATALLGGDLEEARSAQKKFASIERGLGKPRSAVAFSSAELNAWMRQEAQYWAPAAARELRLDLHEGRASGFARIDFLKLKQASGEEPGYLMRHLLAGERPVSVTARIQSRQGQARVDVERVEISGVPLEGAGLDFLLQTYLRATFPDARVGEWFALDKHVNRFQVHRSGVTVLLK